MKKLIAIFVTLIFLFSAAAAESTVVVEKMTDEQLKTMLDYIRNELLVRTARVEEKMFIVDDGKIQIYCTGKGSSNSTTFKLEVVFVNNTGHDAAVYFDHIIIDGWETKEFVTFQFVKSGSKSKENISLNFAAADLESYKDMFDIVLSFHLYDENYKTFLTYDDILINFDGPSWS